MGVSFIAAFLAILLFVPTILFTQQVHTFHDNNGENTKWNNIGIKENIGSKKKKSSSSWQNDDDQVSIKRNHIPLEVGAGSRLPDCSHACGSCTPCRLVLVRFLCASITAQSETCPISYRSAEKMNGMQQQGSVNKDLLGEGFH